MEEKHFASDDRAIDLSSASQAALYGKGVFTTAAVFGGEVFLWEKHWRRLVANARAAGIDISNWDESSLLALLRKRLAGDNIENGRARITFFDRSPSRIWSAGGTTETGISIMTGGLRRLPSNFTITVSPFRMNSASPLAGIKSCNYLENILAIDESRSRGFDEAIRLNERGEVTGFCMANIFWAKDNELFTPSLKTGCLPGTTRELVLEHLECREVEVGIEELKEANAIFVTSAGVGIVQAAAHDGRKLINKPHEITELFPWT